MDQAKSQSQSALIARFVTIGVSSAMILLILPLVLGGLAEKLSLNESTIGFLALFDMVGAAISSLIISRYIASASWKKMLFLAAALMLIGNLLCALVTDLNMVYLARFAAGLGAGLGLSVANAGLAMTANPDRAIGIYVVAALLVGAIALRALPAVTGEIGVDLILYLLVALAVLIALLAMSASAPSVEAVVSDPEVPQSVSPPAVSVPTILIAAAGILFYFMGTGAVWAFMERLGVSLSLSPSYIGTSLSLASLAGGFGGVMAIVLATKFGRLIPAILSILITAFAMFMLANWISSQTYLIGAALILAGWNFSYPYMIGALISADASGKFIPIAASMQLFGFAIGPALSGMIFGEAVYTQSTLLGLVAHLIALALLLPLLIKLEKTASA